MIDNVEIKIENLNLQECSLKIGLFISLKTSFLNETVFIYTIMEV